jgi:hypothetical protein
MAVNSFRAKKCEDFEIVDDNENVVGHIKVSSSGSEPGQSCFALGRVLRWL